MLVCVCVLVCARVFVRVHPPHRRTTTILLGEEADESQSTKRPKVDLPWMASAEQGAGGGAAAAEAAEAAEADALANEMLRKAAEASAAIGVGGSRDNGGGAAAAAAFGGGGGGGAAGALPPAAATAAAAAAVTAPKFEVSIGGVMHAVNKIGASRALQASMSAEESASYKIKLQEYNDYMSDSDSDSD